VVRGFWTAPDPHVLDDGRPFGEQRAIVEHQRWHLAQRVHLSVVTTSFNNLGVFVYLDGRKRQPHLAEQDMEQKR
jgi:hypothetical protein